MTAALTPEQEARVREIAVEVVEQARPTPRTSVVIETGGGFSLERGVTVPPAGLLLQGEVRRG